MKPKNHMKGGLVRPLSKAAIVLTILAAAVAQQLQAGPSPDTVNSLLQERRQGPPTSKSAFLACCQKQVWREAPAGQGGRMSFSAMVSTHCNSVASAEGATAVAGKSAHGSKP